MAEKITAPAIVVDLFFAESKVKAVAQVKEFRWCVGVAEENVTARYDGPAFREQVTRLVAAATTEAIRIMYNSDLYPWWAIAAGDPDGRLSDEYKAQHMPPPEKP